MADPLPTSDGRRRQINVRLDPDEEDRIDKLIRAIHRANGMKASVANIFRMGLVLLEREYAEQLKADQNQVETIRGFRQEKQRQIREQKGGGENEAESDPGS